MGLDADVCASIMSCLDYMEKEDYCYDEDSFFSSKGDSYIGLNMNELKKYAIALVKAHGYRSNYDGMGTAHDLSMLYFGQYENISDDTMRKYYEDIKVVDCNDVIKAIDDYARSISDVGGYMYNAKTTWLSSYCEYRDFSLICSFVNTYLKKVQKEAELSLKMASSNYVGNVGDRITIKVASVRVLYTKGCYSYRGPVVEVLEIKDAQGNIYIWSTSTSVKECDNIVATIKSHSEYRGIRQTIITRGKVLSNDISNTSCTEGTVSDALDLLINYLDN